MTQKLLAPYLTAMALFAITAATESITQSQVADRSTNRSDVAARPVTIPLTIRVKGTKPEPEFE